MMLYLILVFLLSGCVTCPPENEILNFTDTCHKEDCTYQGKCYGQDTWYECRGEGCAIER